MTSSEKSKQFTCGLTDHTFYVRKCCGSLKLSRRDRPGARQGWACQEGRGLAGAREPGLLHSPRGTRAVFGLLTDPFSGPLLH